MIGIALLLSNQRTPSMPQKRRKQNQPTLSKRPPTQSKTVRDDGKAKWLRPLLWLLAWPFLGLAYVILVKGAGWNLNTQAENFRVAGGAEENAASRSDLHCL